VEVLALEKELEEAKDAFEISRIGGKIDKKKKEQAESARAFVKNNLMRSGKSQFDEQIIMRNLIMLELKEEKNSEIANNDDLIKLYKDCLNTCLVDVAHDILESRKQKYYETLDFDNCIRLNTLQTEMHEQI
jgi:hypothetical protein